MKIHILGHHDYTKSGLLLCQIGILTCQRLCTYFSLDVDDCAHDAKLPQDAAGQAKRVPSVTSSHHSRHAKERHMHPKYPYLTAASGQILLYGQPRHVSYSGVASNFSSTMSLALSFTTAMPAAQRFVCYRVFPFRPLCLLQVYQRGLGWHGNHTPLRRPGRICSIVGLSRLHQT